MSQRKRSLKLDEIGYWSEIKLDIIRDYAKAYSTVLRRALMTPQNEAPKPFSAVEHDLG